MAVAAIVVWALYVALATVRPLVAMRLRTGDWGFRPSSGIPRLVAALFPVAYALVSLGPLLDLPGRLHRVQALEGPVAQTVGLVLAAAGLPVIVVAQETMGRSWRIGVDVEERTALVTGGPFRWVRNPIYTAMVLMATGVALLVPDAVTLAGLGLLLVAVELQTRVVEEPYLLTAHGDSYRRYAAASGRFLPGVGHLVQPSTSS